MPKTEKRRTFRTWLADSGFFFLRDRTMKRSGRVIGGSSPLKFCIINKQKYEKAYNEGPQGQIEQKACVNSYWWLKAKFTQITQVSNFLL